MDSFIANATINRDDLPDNDGVIRRTVPVNTVVQGAGGTLKGIELSARQSLGDYGVNGPLGGFGLDANYTLSLGRTGRVDLAGDDQPFQDNSKHQINAALWYEKYGFQARLAYNYRSKRLVSSDYNGIVGLALYQRPTQYLDASVSYDVLPNITLYGQASNLSGETERYYLTFPTRRCTRTSTSAASRRVSGLASDASAARATLGRMSAPSNLDREDDRPMMDRRTFIGATAALAAAPAAARKAEHAVGLQLYTLRTLFEPDPSARSRRLRGSAIARSSIAAAGTTAWTTPCFGGPWTGWVCARHRSTSASRASGKTSPPR